MATLLFNGERIEASRGETIMTAAGRSARGTHEIASSCPGEGRCRECVVQIKSGNPTLTPPSEAETFLTHQSDSEQTVFRLACQAALAGDDAVVEVESFKRRLEIATRGRPALDTFDPWITRSGRHVNCDDKELTEHAGALFGLALDVGTTTVVVHAVNLETGETIDVSAFENPQRFGGSDVIHRISYDRHYPGQLHRTIISRVNTVLRGLPIDPESVLAVTVAGNPTVRDLFFGLDVQPIGQSPFMSQTQVEMLAGRRASTALRSTGRELGLEVHPLAQVYGLPLISNHVGADMAAVLATLPIGQHHEPFMAIDIGTNTEVVMGNRDRLVAASCPAGPAFEGGQLSCGMPACDGAITSLRRTDTAWAFDSIGAVPVRGVCGSGLVDLLAELRAGGEMDELGRFSNGTAHIPICDASNLSFTRRDASELAQAKAANALGQAVLLRKFGIEPSQLDAYYLAGAFANKMDLAHARRIGLILPVPDERVVRIGNASIEGAKAVLLSRTCRERIETLVTRIEHVELEEEPDFFELFAEMTQFQPIANA